MNTRKIFLMLLLTISCGLYAAKIDTLMVNSPSMNKEVEVVVVAPDIALGKDAQNCPAIYLLHGYGGNAHTWLGIKSNLKEIADEKGVFFVCPDGKNSWYWDSPKDPSFRYETFVSTELVQFIDSNYRTVSDRKGRAITGLSMGGHGGLWISIRHKDTFGAGGSTSGGVDIRPFPMNWNMNKQLGEYAANKRVWDEHTVINQLDKLSNGDLTIIIDCGMGDFFLSVNEELHRRLLGRGIDHDFILRPGVHNNAYWKNSIDYQILFFHKFFSERN